MSHTDQYCLCYLRNSEAMSFVSFVCFPLFFLSHESHRLATLILRQYFECAPDGRFSPCHVDSYYEIHDFI